MGVEIKYADGRVFFKDWVEGMFGCSLEELQDELKDNDDADWERIYDRFLSWAQEKKLQAYYE